MQGGGDGDPGEPQLWPRGWPGPAPGSQPGPAAALCQCRPSLCLPEQTAGQLTGLTGGSQAEEAGRDEAGGGPGGSPHHQLPSLQSPALRPPTAQIRGHLDLRNHPERVLEFIKRSK